MRVEWTPQREDIEQGLDQGVLYLNSTGVAWNGLVSVDERDTTDVFSEQYIDGVRTVVIQNLGEYGARVEAFTFPDELDEETIFGFSYRIPQEKGYKIHLVYNALFRPSEKTYLSVSDTITPTNFEWDLHATPVKVLGANPVAHLILDTTEYPDVTETLEEILYGTDTTEPRLPTPQEVIDICEFVATLKITHNGDGTWTAEGPDHIVINNPDGSFTINAPTLFHLEDGKFVVGSF